MSVLATTDVWSLCVAAAGIGLLCGLGVRILLSDAGRWILGPVVFLAAGAYGMGIPLAAGLSPWLAAPLGIAVSALAGLLLVRPATRLRPEVLAALTVCLGEVARRGIEADPGGHTGGAAGLADGRGGWPGAEADITQWLTARSIDLGRWAPLALLAWIVAGLAWLLHSRLARAPWGRAVIVAREDHGLAAAAGTRPGLRRAQALVIGAAVTGAAGELLMLLRPGGVSAGQIAPVLAIAAVALALPTLRRRSWLTVVATVVAVLVAVAALADLPVSPARAVGIATALLGAAVVALAFAATAIRGGQDA